MVGEVLFDLVRDTGATFVLVTHDLSLARACDRVLRLHEGALAEAPATGEAAPRATGRRGAAG